MNRDDPLVLGIETSCDETGIGIVRGRPLDDIPPLQHEPHDAEGAVEQRETDQRDEHGACRMVGHTVLHQHVDAGGVEVVGPVGHDHPRLTSHLGEDPAGCVGQERRRDHPEREQTELA